MNFSNISSFQDERLLKSFDDLQDSLSFQYKSSKSDLDLNHFPKPKFDSTYYTDDIHDYNNDSFKLYEDKKEQYTKTYEEIKNTLKDLFDVYLNDNLTILNESVLCEEILLKNTLENMSFNAEKHILSFNEQNKYNKVEQKRVDNLESELKIRDKYINYLTELTNKYKEMERESMNMGNILESFNTKRLDPPKDTIFRNIESLKNHYANELRYVEDYRQKLENDIINERKLNEEEIIYMKGEIMNQKLNTSPVKKSEIEAMTSRYNKMIIKNQDLFVELFNLRYEIERQRKKIEVVRGATDRVRSLKKLYEDKTFQISSRLMEDVADIQHKCKLQQKEVHSIREKINEMIKEKSTLDENIKEYKKIQSSLEELFHIEIQKERYFSESERLINILDILQANNFTEEADKYYSEPYKVRAVAIEKELNEIQKEINDLKNEEIKYEKHNKDLHDTHSITETKTGPLTSSTEKYNDPPNIPGSNSINIEKLKKTIETISPLIVQIKERIENKKATVDSLKFRIKDVDLDCSINSEENTTIANEEIVSSMNELSENIFSELLIWVSETNSNSKEDIMKKWVSVIDELTDRLCGRR